MLFGETGVASGLVPGKAVIDMRSISPIATRQFAQRMNALEALACFEVGQAAA